MKKGNKKLTLPKHRATTTPTVLGSGHAAQGPARQKELVRAPEDATTVNALRKRDVPAKSQMEAGAVRLETVTQKLPEPHRISSATWSRSRDPYMWPVPRARRFDQMRVSTQRLDAAITLPI